VIGCRSRYEEGNRGEMVVIDLKIFPGGSHTSAFKQKEMADELWPNNVFPADGLCAFSRLSPMYISFQEDVICRLVAIRTNILVDNNIFLEVSLLSQIQYTEFLD